MTSRLAVLRKGRGHPFRGRREAAKAVARRPDEAALGGDPSRGERGSVDRAVVLGDRIGCRRRHAAHGPRDPGRRARVIVENLAPPCESIGGANERRKPDRGGKVARSVAGAACECGRSTCRYRRRSGPGKLSLLTQGRWKRSWLLVKPRLVRGGSGRDRERQRSRPSASIAAE